MRKAVKLAAMSTLAAVAMVGGSATVASADNGDKNGYGHKAEASAGYKGEAGRQDDDRNNNKGRQDDDRNNNKGHKDDDKDHNEYKVADNICGNEGQGPVVGHDNVHTEEGGSILCQSGENNVAYNYVEGNEVGDDLVSQTLAQIIGEVDIES